MISNEEKMKRNKEKVKVKAKAVSKYSRFVVIAAFSICLLATLILVGSIGKTNVYAATSGTSGTVNWTIDDDGLLTLTPINGTEGTLGSFGDSVIWVPWYEYRSSIKSFKVAEGTTVNGGEILNGMFYECTNLTTIDLSGLKTTNVTNMYGMFSNCSKLTSLDLSTIDTSKVTDMYGMFSECRKLTSLDLSGFKTTNVTNMYAMFYECESLTSLDLSTFDTSKVTDISYMFFYCENLTSIDISNFNTSKVTDMESMFSGCVKLTSLDLSNFDTSKVIYIANMFSSCVKLTSLDLSNFDTSKVINMANMFSSCSKLTSLNLTGFYTEMDNPNVKTMFSDTNLLSVILGNNTNGAVKGAIIAPTAEETDPVTGAVKTGNWINAEGETYTSLGSAPSGTYRLEVKDGTHLNLTLPTVTFEINPIEEAYTGSEIKPIATVKNTSTNSTLIEGTHYEVTYANNVSAAESTASTAPTVTITGLWGCLGNRSETFTISPISIATATISSIDSYVYDGNAYTPVPEVSLGGKNLDAATDFTYIYKTAGGTPITSPTDKGTYTVEITGKGGYTSNISATFIISERSIEGATISAIPSHTFDDTAYTPVPTVELGDTTLENPRDFTYGYLDKDGIATTSPTNAGIYTLVINGTGNYGETTSTTFEITAKDLTGASVASIADADYSPNGYVPVPEVTLDGAVLKAGTDFTYTYSDNRRAIIDNPTNVGAYTVAIEGIGNYEGNLSASFNITAKSIVGGSIDDIDSHVYNGNSYTPVPVVRVDGVVLEPTRDFTYEYLNAVGDRITSPTEEGTYTLQVIGNGNYAEDELITTFNIVSESEPTPVAPNTDQTGASGKTPPSTGDSLGIFIICASLLALVAASCLVLTKVVRSRS